MPFLSSSHSASFSHPILFCQLFISFSSPLSFFIFFLPDKHSCLLFLAYLSFLLFVICLLISLLSVPVSWSLPPFMPPSYASLTLCHFISLFCLRAPVKFPLLTYLRLLSFFHLIYWFVCLSTNKLQVAVPFWIDVGSIHGVKLRQQREYQCCLVAISIAGLRV